MMHGPVLKKVASLVQGIDHQTSQEQADVTDKFTRHVQKVQQQMKCTSPVADYK